MHLWRLRKVMIREDVLLRAAIRSDVTVKTPLSAGDRVEQPRIGAARYAVDCIVRAHQAGDVALLDARLEGRHVRVEQVALRDALVDVVPRARLAQAVYDIPEVEAERKRRLEEWYGKGSVGQE